MPVVVIGPPVRPLPVATDVTLPPTLPLEAEVIRPCASTVAVIFVYEAGVTAVFARAIVPEVVIAPPLSPVPAVIDVTVPVPPTELITPPETVIVLPSGLTQPGTTVVAVAQTIVPAPVIGPPLRPLPVATDVTVPAVPLVADVIRPCASTVIFGFMYVVAATPVLVRESTPDVVIGPPVKPVPLPTDVTVPLPPPPEPFAAAVNLPCASTVIFALVYDPAVTAVLARAIVPMLVITPPLKPVPAVIDVTATPLEAFVILPCALTVIVELVYVPGTTVVFASIIVPLVVIGPPTIPDTDGIPVLIDVTVPKPANELITPLEITIVVPSGLTQPVINTVAIGQVAITPALIYVFNVSIVDKTV